MSHFASRALPFVLATGLLISAPAHADGTMHDTAGQGGEPGRHLSPAEADAFVHGQPVHGISPVSARLTRGQTRCYDNSLGPTPCARARDCGLPYFITGAICP